MKDEVGYATAKGSRTPLVSECPGTGLEFLWNTHNRRNDHFVEPDHSHAQADRRAGSFLHDLLTNQESRHPLSGNSPVKSELASYVERRRHTTAKAHATLLGRHSGVSRGILQKDGRFVTGICLWVGTGQNEMRARHRGWSEAVMHVRRTRLSCILRGEISWFTENKETARESEEANASHN